MIQKEFEERTGISMTADDFTTVHDIYMACGDRMDKDEFCTLWKGKKFWELLSRVTDEKKITEQAYGIAMQKTSRIKEQQTERNMELAELILGKAEAYDDTDFYNEAVKLVGMKAVISAKLRLDLPLWDEDKTYISNNLE